jgi:hypothetical protein
VAGHKKTVPRRQYGIGADRHTGAHATARNVNRYNRWVSSAIGHAWNRQDLINLNA